MCGNDHRRIAAQQPHTTQAPRDERPRIDVDPPATDDRLKSGWVYQGVSSADLFFDVQDLTSDEELYDNTGPVSDSDDGKFAWGGSSYSKAGVVERITAPVYYTDC